MTDHEDVLSDLDAALQVEPSRTFADGVRARVDRSRANTARMWWGLAAAASIGLVTMTLWRPATGPSANDATVPVQVTAVPTQPTAPGVPSKTPESVVAMAPDAPPVVTRREATVVAIASEPQLEVITSQGAVLRQLWADYRGRPLVLAEGEPVVQDSATGAIVVNPIVVPPIVVSEIGKEPGPGPAGATPVIRRADATKETR